MALSILYVGRRNSLGNLNDAGFTRSNTSGNAQIAANTTLLPYSTIVGVLGGSIAAMVASDVVGPADGPTDAIVGLFLNNAAGNPFENSPAAASGVAPYISGTGSYEVDIYETADTSGNPITLPLVGEFLYSSQNGLLTSSRGLSGGTVPAGSTIIGIVTVAPTVGAPIMRFDLRI